MTGVFVHSRQFSEAVETCFRIPKKVLMEVKHGQRTTVDIGLNRIARTENPES